MSDWKKRKIKIYFGSKHVMHEKEKGIPYINVELGNLSVIKELLHAEHTRTLKEIEGIIPKEIKSDISQRSYSGAYVKGYNQALSDILSALKEKV